MSASIPQAPRGWAMLALVGPSMIWCAEYIGSGEVVLATRTGALLGTAGLWVVVVAIGLKSCIGMAAARWAAVTGEGMIDMFDRLPGPRHWMIWLILAVQVPAAIVSVGAVARTAGAFLNAWLPLAGGQVVWAVAASLFALAVAWSGRFDVLKTVMSALVAAIVLGVVYVALTTLPAARDLLAGLFGLAPMEIPAWAAGLGAAPSPWHEILPLTGWAAGGFASQVWYSYWVLGAGYGMAAGRGWGRPAEAPALAALDPRAAAEVRGWCRLVRLDACLAAAVGILITSAFMIAGAGVLRPAQVLPAGNQVALTLSTLFSDRWGRAGGILFLVAGSAAMISTLVGQLSGWPRLLTDCARIVWPPTARIRLVTRFRTILVGLWVGNLLIAFWLDPVRLVRLGGQLDGVLLTPIQAGSLLAAFYVVLPRIVPRASWRILRPGPALTVLLAAAALVYAVLCVVFLPGSLRAVFAD